MTITESSLSDEQRAALLPRIRLIEAGPGAGKTKTVVARFRRRATEGCGVALLSFTNAAVDVAKARCRDAPKMAEAPNFIGTFDQFFHRYVLTVDVRRQVGVSPKYLSSWDDLPGHLAVVRLGTGGAGIRLSRFTVQSADRWELDERRLNRSERQIWDKLLDGARWQLNDSASKRIAGLHNSYVYDTAEARVRALMVMADPAAPYLDHLRRRFPEVIVDEFQDCDQVEHHLLDLLTSAGIHVVAVADPDQGIYEFRQSRTGIYERYRAGLDPLVIARLNTCYRSAPAICSLTSSLRSVGVGPIVADPNHRGGPTVIHVVVGSGIRAGAAALEIVRQSGVEARHTRVVAHRRSDARALIRQGNEPPKGQSQMESLLVPLAELRSGIDARGRLSAAKRMEAFILNQFDWNTGQGVHTKDDQVELLGVLPERLRVIVSNLLSSSEWPDAQSCSKGVRAILEELARESAIPLRPRLGQRLRVLPKVWTFWQSRTGSMFAAAEVGATRWTHIHGVKGDEFEGVILAIPAKSAGAIHVLDDWESDRNSEQRRVFYVGASRAGRVLVLVVPRSRRKQLIDILTRDSVLHTITTIN